MPRDIATVHEFDLNTARPDALGARFDGEGTNFALFSDHAEKVELCLFDASGHETRLELPLMEGGIWYGYLPGVRPGQAYGYRVHGPWDPENGHRFNPNKLLLDPYAMEITGALTWDPALFGHRAGESDLVMDDRDSAPFMPRAVVADPAYDWDEDAALDHRWSETLIYEAHVKGLTQLHPEVPKAIRGTFRGLGSDAVIDHLKTLGVTAIELLPIHAAVNDQRLTEMGLSNYWGYNTIGFFAPNRSYLASGRVAEVKETVDRLHKAGIEVILDVVYNHTAEGSELGPTLSFRGIDNRSYYLADDPRHTYDTTGTGNTLNVAHPMVLRMVMDSLRYWVEVMHVDGFRFDLASTLGREPQGFEREGAFFGALRQDPVLSKVKLIAEPWDVGLGGYQVGGFPWPLREWNDKFRDDTRAFWRKDPALMPRLAQRLLGSPTQFHHSRRPATTSVNFVSAHDGFTLWDTVSFNDRHNEANGEDNRDGHSNNLSDNMGHEGATNDPATNDARTRRAKAMLATLLLSHGVPMLLGGDEIGNSQNGNNNAYAQDNEISWLDWAGANGALTRAVRDLARLRKDWSGWLAPQGFAHAPGETPRPFGVESDWWHPDGRGMADGDWHDEGLCAFGLRLGRAGRGREILIVLNAGDDTNFRLPDGPAWRQIIDTSADPVTVDATPDEVTGLGWQSVAVFVRE